MTGAPEQFMLIPIRCGESLTNSMPLPVHMVADIPFINCVRLYYMPVDFDHCTRYQRASLFAAAEAEYGGNDLTVVANKLIAICVRLTPPARWPLLALAAPAALLALCIAHVALAFDRDSKNDPPGDSLCTVKG